MKTHTAARAILFAALLAGAASFGQQPANPWPESAIVEPAALASLLESSAAEPPTILCVAFPVLYHARHIQNAIFAGPTSKPEGMEALRKAVADLDKDTDLVLYCGCCPMEKCPNVRPAYSALKEMGFTRVRVLNIPTNMPTDWYAKNYPSEPGDDAAPDSKR
jgi:Rhodanese-like domain